MPPWWLTAIAVSATGWLAAVLAIWQFGRRQRVNAPPEVVVVVGCRVGPDGEPGPALARRARHGARVAAAFGVPLVATGANGEAEAIARVAVQHGAPTVVLERRARTTVDNARYTAGLGRWTRVAVVSDDVHLLRCAIAFRWHFPAVTLEAAEPGPLRWRMATRELVGLVLLPARLVLTSRTPSDRPD